MRYTRVHMDAIGYELAPRVVTSKEIETRLKPFYDKVGFSPGQLEALTGIRERRFWDIEHTLSEGCAKASQKAIETAGILPGQVETLVYCGVGKDGFEPATACHIAANLNINPNAQIFDISNACLGVMTGMVQVANEIELGHIKAGLVVSSETARQIVDATILEINQAMDIEFFKNTIATMTGGSGAVAVLLTDGTIGGSGCGRHRVKGGVVKQASRFHDLCRWGFKDSGMPTDSTVIMRTDAVGVLEHGLELARDTFKAFKNELGLSIDQPDKYICHQVGSAHREMFHKAFDIDPAKDFSTYPYLGNMGTVSLPMTAAIAQERGFLGTGDYVGFLGIGSGLNCLMIGVKW